MKYIKTLFDFSGCKGSGCEWGEPTRKDVALVFFASFAYFALLFWLGC